MTTTKYSYLRINYLASNHSGKIIIKMSQYKWLWLSVIDHIDYQIMSAHTQGHNTIATASLLTVTLYKLEALLYNYRGIYMAMAYKNKHNAKHKFN